MSIKSDKSVKISQKHLLGIQDLSISDVNFILNEAKQFIKLNKSKNKKLDILKGKTQINLFFDLQQGHKVLLNWLEKDWVQMLCQ